MRVITINWQYLLPVFCLVITLSGCGGSSDDSPGPFSTGGGGGSSSGFINGPLTGDLWTTGIRSFRFNFQTGNEAQIGNGFVYPSKDGRTYVDYTEEVAFLEPPEGACLINVARPLDQVDIRDTASGALLSSFQTVYDISPPIRLSPDGNRILAVASPREECSRVASSLRDALTVFSIDGTVLFRGPESIVHPAFEWTPDGRILRANKIAIDTYLMEIETAVGSYNFQNFIDIRVDSPSEDEFLRRVRVNSDGTKFLMEFVTDQSSGLSTVFTRDSYVLLLDLEEETINDVFRNNETFGDLRANEALFSPDENWILTTHGFSGGVVLLSNNISDGSEIFTDVALISAPPTGTSYVVPVNTIEQLLPPNQISEMVRPVIGFHDGQAAAVGFSPRVDQSWTPSIE